MEHTNENAPTVASRRQGITVASAALWASAFLLAALTIIQAGRLPFNAAYGAGAANQGGQGTSVVTLNTGLGPDSKP